MEMKIKNWEDLDGKENKEYSICFAATFIRIYDYTSNFVIDISIKHNTENGISLSISIRELKPQNYYIICSVTFQLGPLFARNFLLLFCSRQAEALTHIASQSHIIL